MILKSALLSGIPRVRHGFSTRLGGVSSGPFATLNLDFSVGDDAEAVRENTARFRMMIGLRADQELMQSRQVHGTDILIAPPVSLAAQPADAPEGHGHTHPGLRAGAERRDDEAPEGDGLISNRAGIAVGIRTADCVPILIACTSSSGDPIAVAAVHAGWRGATLGVLDRAVSALEAEGADRSRMFLALGPAIGAESFEVGEEVVEAAARSLGGRAPPIVRNARGRWHLDLRRLVEMQLDLLDIRRDRISAVGGSTYGEPSLYFSHRRDRGITGRHLSAIAFV